MESTNIINSTINPDPLSKLALKYLTDKCPQIKHPFTPFYFELLKDKRRSIRKVLEIGIGNLDETLRQRPYRIGASLYMWRDFFPNAQIYGADIRPETLFQDERIKTYLCDERIKEDLERLIQETDSDIDLIIDDGSHNLNDQIFACMSLMPIVQSDVIYIIEDVTAPETIATALNMYNCSIPKLKRRFRDDNLVIVTNKK